MNTDSIEFPKDFKNPAWDKVADVRGDGFRDWKNYVPDAVRFTWQRFTYTQRMLLAKWAQQIADAAKQESNW